MITSRARTHMHTHTHAHAHTCTFAHARAYTLAHTHTYTHTYTHAHVHTRARAHMHTHMHICTHAQRERRTRYRPHVALASRRHARIKATVTLQLSCEVSFSLWSSSGTWVSRHSYPPLWRSSVTATAQQLVRSDLDLPVDYGICTSHGRGWNLGQGRALL